MAVFNQYCVKYKPGEPVKLRFFDFNMGEIKYITKYECKDYLVLPIYITRVGWFDMRQDELIGVENAVVLLWQGFNRIPGRIAPTDEVIRRNSAMRKKNDFLPQETMLHPEKIPFLR